MKNRKRKTRSDKFPLTLHPTEQSVSLPRPKVRRTAFEIGGFLAVSDHGYSGTRETRLIAKPLYSPINERRDRLQGKEKSVRQCATNQDAPRTDLQIYRIHGMLQ